MNKPLPPTDLELMQLFDDELAEPRRSEVRAFVASSSRAQAKIHGLGEVGSFLRAAVDATPDPLAADDLASRVLELAGPLGPASGFEHRATESVHPGDATAKVVTPKAPTKGAAPVDPAPSNDNARRIFGLAGIAAAAAAALVFWGRTAPTDDPGRQALPAPTGRDTGAVIAPSSTQPSLAQTDASGEVKSDPPSEGGVEVASVDFGKRSGAIFHVPIDARGATTTVLWLSDE